MCHWAVWKNFLKIWCRVMLVNRTVATHSQFWTYSGNKVVFKVVQVVTSRNDDSLHPYHTWPVSNEDEIALSFNNPILSLHYLNLVIFYFWRLLLLLLLLPEKLSKFTVTEGSSSLLALESIERPVILVLSVVQSQLPTACGLATVCLYWPAQYSNFTLVTKSNPVLFKCILHI